MKRLLFTISLFFLSLASYSQEYSITYDGLVRTYRLHLPQGYNAESLYPLVISMHGITSNAWQQEWLTGFNDVADQQGFIVVYPNGVDASWNISSTTGVDDVGFISALIDSLDVLYSMDLNRVYASGMSMGGFMAYRLACELSNRIAAIASVTGLQSFFPCNPPKPVPVLDMHGTADPVVPYVGVASTISFWVDHNGCPQEPVITDLPDINQTDSSTVTTSYYGSCNNSTEVILYTIINGEHSWPGSIIMLGITNKDINASNEIWNFFRKFNLHGSTGIDMANSQNNNLLSIYPNPARSFLTVELKSSIPETFDFQIFDLSGRKVDEVLNISDPRFIVDCHDLPSGMYMAVIRCKNGLIHQKFIIR